MASLEEALTRLERRGDEEAMHSVAMGAPMADDEQLARLTRILAATGGSVKEASTEVGDIASTGGPGSLSTLLAPLLARSLGIGISKIAVPGRPAGGLDVLGTLPGYRTELSIRDARDVFEECGYLHVGAGQAFCPLDARFFAWRQANGYQAVGSLAITSLLSKKVAAGAGRVVLDVRVGPHGNFGTDLESARRNANRFVSVARLLGITAICVLTESRGLLQPWIGRGEAAAALSLVLDGEATGQLERHATACLRMAELAADSPPASFGGLLEGARAAHHRMLAAHGCSEEAFWSRARQMRDVLRVPVRAETTGRPRWNIDGLRQLLVERQRSATVPRGQDFNDPCGVCLADIEVPCVSVGSVLAGVRDLSDAPYLAAQVAGLVDMDPGTDNDGVFAEPEVVRG